VFVTIDEFLKTSAHLLEKHTLFPRLLLMKL